MIPILYLHIKNKQDRHLLPQRYLAEIADYITQRARQAAPMLGTAAPAVTAAVAAGGGFTGVGDPSAGALYVYVIIYVLAAAAVGGGGR